MPEHKTVLHVFGKHILHVLANLLSGFVVNLKQHVKKSKKFFNFETKNHEFCRLNWPPFSCNIDALIYNLLYNLLQIP